LFERAAVIFDYFGGKKRFGGANLSPAALNAVCGVYFLSGADKAFRAVKNPLEL